ncbi:MAG TPA: tetratricopeptide repeat protein, partial [Steroidobacteraceae bacterium]|nr:tetratricopeptide repeat protein [Steroidobacteraceae bacterium]
PYPDFAASLNDLGLMLYYDKGDYDRAEQLLLESMAMKRKLLGDKHPEIATSLSNIADVLHNKGDLAGAEKDYLQSLAMYRELLGNEHPYVARTLNNLAFVYYDKGDVSAALQTERESLAIYRKNFPGDNPDVARVENRLGYWLIETGQYTAAERCLNEALAMRIRLFGKSHPEVASSLVHVAVLDVAIHKYPDAIVAAHAAAAIFTKALSATSWETAVANSVEGAARGDMGEYAAAEAELLRNYAILKNDGGAVPMYRALVRRYMQTLYQRWGRRRDAQRYAAMR